MRSHSYSQTFHLCMTDKKNLPKRKVICMTCTKAPSNHFESVFLIYLVVTVLMDLLKVWRIKLYNEWVICIKQGQIQLCRPNLSFCSTAWKHKSDTQLKVFFCILWMNKRYLMIAVNIGSKIISIMVKSILKIIKSMQDLVS